jgi:hypothetical protein
MMSRGDGEIPRQQQSCAPSPKIRLVDTLKRQFRAVMKVLARREEEPVVKARRRKRDEGQGGFRAAATRLFRRVAVAMPIPISGDWEPFTWLRLWEYEQPEILGHQVTDSLSDGLFPQP